MCVRSKNDWKGLNLNGSLIISLTFFKLAGVGAGDELSCKKSKWLCAAHSDFCCLMVILLNEFKISNQTKAAVKLLLLFFCNKQK